VRQSAIYRSTALLVALLVSFAAPGLALAHGQTHDHLARAQAAHDVPHADGAGHDSADASDDHARLAISPAEHRHAHGHATLDVAPAVRSIGHVAAVAPVAAELPLPQAATDVRVVVPAACTDEAVLPRPAPAAGAPSSPRAPPSLT